jgi:hypothetical protein
VFVGRVDAGDVPYGLRLKHGLTVSKQLSLKGVGDQLLRLLFNLKGAGEQGHPPPASVSDDIFVNVSALSGRSDALRDGGSTTLEYHSSRRDHVVHIEPAMGYLSDYRKGGPIAAMSYTWEPFAWGFPKLDLKIVNNSDETIFLTEAVLDVQDSRIDPFPVLIIKHDLYQSNALHFWLFNDGWGDVLHLKARFHLTPLRDAGPTPSFDEPYPHEVAVGDFLEGCNVDLSDAFRDAGVDFDGLEALGKVWMSSGDGVVVRDGAGNDMEMTWQQYAQKRSAHLGPFVQGAALVSGELEFSGRTIGGSIEQHKVKFSTVVWLFNEYRAGVPAPPSYQYATKFEVEGSNYERRVPISHVLKPQEADRFVIEIGMDKSSRHEFRLKLLYNNDRATESQELVMTTFVPRSGIVYLKNGDS